MKKLTYLFVMIAGMTLATLNVNAQDAKNSAPAKKESTAACCQGGTKTMAAKCSMKETTSAQADKGTNTSGKAVTNKTAACCKAKMEPTVSEVKVKK